MLEFRVPFCVPGINIIKQLEGFKWFYGIMQSSDLADLISISEAARIRKVSPQAIDELVKKGRFRVIRVGGRSLLSRKEVASYKASKGGRPRKTSRSR